MRLVKFVSARSSREGSESVAEVLLYEVVGQHGGLGRHRNAVVLTRSGYMRGERTREKRIMYKRRDM